MPSVVSSNTPRTRAESKPFKNCEWLLNSMPSGRLQRLALSFGTYGLRRCMTGTTTAILARDQKTFRRTQTKCTDIRAGKDTAIGSVQSRFGATLRQLAITFAASD